MRPAPRFRLAALLSVLCAPVVHAQIPPQRLASAWSLDALEERCSLEGLVYDAPCEQAIKMDLGAQPAVYVVRLPNGGEQETTTYLDPDVARATALMEQACGSQHWQSCMLYASLLEDGKRVPRDLAHARALQQWACASGHFRACEWLKDHHVALEKPATSPVLQWTGSARGPQTLPKRIALALPPPTPTPPPTAKAGPAVQSDADKIRALLAKKCEGAACGPPAPPPTPSAPKIDATDMRQFCFTLMKFAACQRLGTLIREGRVEPNSPHEQKDAFHAACLGGYKDACADGQ